MEDDDFFVRCCAAESVIVLTSAIASAKRKRLKTSFTLVETSVPKAKWIRRTDVHKQLGANAGIEVICLGIKTVL